jgi:hypothetical protein
VRKNPGTVVDVIGRVLIAVAVLTTGWMLLQIPPEQSLHVTPQRITFNIETDVSTATKDPTDIYLEYWGGGDGESVTLRFNSGPPVRAVQLFVAEGTISSGDWSCVSSNSDAATERATSISANDLSTANSIYDSAAYFYPSFNLAPAAFSSAVSVAAADDSPLRSVTCERSGDLWPILAYPDRFFAPPITTVAVNVDDSFTLSTHRESTFPGDANPKVGIVRFENDVRIETGGEFTDGEQTGPARWRDQTLILRDSTAEAQQQHSDYVVAGLAGAVVALLIEWVFAPLRKKSANGTKHDATPAGVVAVPGAKFAAVHAITKPVDRMRHFARLKRGSITRANRRR